MDSRVERHHVEADGGEAHQAQVAGAVEELRRLLGGLMPGKVAEELYETLAELISDSFYAFKWPPSGGMKPDKLWGRLEEVTWEPPTLGFSIERHGATTFGSSRAEIQRWHLDLQQLEASYYEKGFRQLYPRSSPLKVEPIAQELAQAMLEGRRHPNLRWCKSGRVRVLSTELLGGFDTPQQTLAGRRRRLRRALLALLEPHGWEAIGSGYYLPPAPRGRHPRRARKSEGEDEESG